MPTPRNQLVSIIDTTWHQCVSRCVQPKRGHIDNNFPPILQKLNIDTENWLHIATTFEDSFGPWIGLTERIQQICKSTKRHWVHRTVSCEKLHPT